MSGFIGVSLFLAGCCIGALLQKLFSSPGSTQKLSSELDSVSQEFAQYQDRVDTHFRETAELVNNLTQDYVKLHQKLASGASELSRASVPSLATTAALTEQSQAETDTEDKIMPPRDYTEKP